MTDLQFPREHEEFMVDKTVEGFEPAEIRLLMERRFNAPYSEEEIAGFVGRDGTQERVETERSIQEKQAQLSRDDLVVELRGLMDSLVEKRERLEGRDDEVDSATVGNMLKLVRQLGEYIEVLESKDGGATNNVVNINELEQNFDLTQSVQFLPAEDKRDVVRQLQDDPDVEDFVIKRGTD